MFLNPHPVKTSPASHSRGASQETSTLYVARVSNSYGMNSPADHIDCTSSITGKMNWCVWCPTLHVAARTAQAQLGLRHRNEEVAPCVSQVASSKPPKHISFTRKRDACTNTITVAVSTCTFPSEER